MILYTINMCFYRERLYKTFKRLYIYIYFKMMMYLPYMECILIYVKVSNLDILVYWTLDTASGMF